MEARACYRVLLRAIAKTFKDDARMRTGAIEEVRIHYDKARHIVDEQEIQACLRMGYEAAEFLTENIVQGRMNDKGNYGKTRMIEGKKEKEEKKLAIRWDVGADICPIALQLYFLIIFLWSYNTAVKLHSHHGSQVAGEKPLMGAAEAVKVAEGEERRRKE